MAITPENSAETLAKFSTMKNPGRIVAVAWSEDGLLLRLFAGMGGRSVGSRNRFYLQLEDLNGNGDLVKTAVHDPNLQQGDPTATIYTAQRSWGGEHVASNGEQTDGISFALSLRVPFEIAQRKYRNEGPKNKYTARITVALDQRVPCADVGKIVSDKDNPSDSLYKFWHYHPNLNNFHPGEGFLTATYDGQGGYGPNYDQPYGLLLPGTLDDNMDLLWSNWDPETKAGLVGKEVEIGSGRWKYSFRSIHPGRA